MNNDRRDANDRLADKMLEILNGQPTFPPYEAPRVVEDLLLEIESLACGKSAGRGCHRGGGIRS